MILCDIGNSNIDFYEDGKIWSQSVAAFDLTHFSQSVYFISVNDAIDMKLSKQKNFINIESWFDFDTIYQGMGIDRIAACSTINDGIVVDAGTAITVDIMSCGMHLGGFILPGINAIAKTYKDISPRLDVRINPNIALDALPQKTQDAVSYGTIKSIILMLESICQDKTLFFTGGDGKFFAKFFKKSIYDRSLLFRGMLKAIEKNTKKDI